MCPEHARRTAGRRGARGALSYGVGTPTKGVYCGDTHARLHARCHIAEGTAAASARSADVDHLLDLLVHSLPVFLLQHRLPLSLLICLSWFLQFILQFHFIIITISYFIHHLQHLLHLQPM